MWIDTLSGNEAKEKLREIYRVLWANGADSEWDSGTASAINEVVPFESPVESLDPEYAALVMKCREQARAEYVASSDCRIAVDDNAGLSVGEDGCWVEAWLFVDKDC